MRNLIYKELRLAAHPTLFIFTLMGALVLVPNYPYSVVFLFGCMAPYITFLFGRETNDTFYTALLPVRKRDIVKSKCALLLLVQITQILISIPCSIWKVFFYTQGNAVGMEANVAYYGFGLMIFAIFNFIFFSEFYKTAYKAGRAFLLAILPATLMMTIVEILPHIPGLQWIKSLDGSMLLRQIPILALGILIYAGGMILTFRRAAKRFEAVDL